MLPPVDNESVKKVLKQHSELTQQIHNRIMQIRKEVAETNKQLIEIASYPKEDYTREPGGKGEHTDLTDTYLRYQKLVEEKERELATEMGELINQMESINRLYICFQALKGNVAFTILERLYVKKELYKAVEMDSGFSHKTFETYRQQGIQFIKTLYDSNLTNAQIIRNTKRKGAKRGKSQKDTPDTYEQLSLF